MYKEKDSFIKIFISTERSCRVDLTIRLLNSDLGQMKSILRYTVRQTQLH